MIDPRTHVYLLGAGASFGARLEQSAGPPPLGKQLGGYLHRWVQRERQDFEAHRILEVTSARDELRSAVVADDDIPPVIHLLARMADHESNHESTGGSDGEASFERVVRELVGTDGGEVRATLRHLNRVLAASLLGGRECAAGPGPDLYDELLRLHPRGDQLAFITLNYDLLLEEALERAGIAADYGAGIVRLPGDSTATAVPVCKPHGSANWFAHRVPTVSATLSVAIQAAQEHPASYPEVGTIAGRQQFAREQLGSSVGARDRTNALLELEYVPDAEVVMALYAESKVTTSNHSQLDRARQDGLQLLEHAARVTVIGVALDRAFADVDSASRDDPFLASAVATLVRRAAGIRVEVADPNPCGLALGAGFRHAAEGLRGYIDVRRTPARS